MNEHTDTGLPAAGLLLIGCNGQSPAGHRPGAFFCFCVCLQGPNCELPSCVSRCLPLLVSCVPAFWASHHCLTLVAVSPDWFTSLSPCFPLPCLLQGQQLPGSLSKAAETAPVAFKTVMLGAVPQWFLGPHFSLLYPSGHIDLPSGQASSSLRALASSFASGTLFPKCGPSRSLLSSHFPYAGDPSVPSSLMILDHYQPPASLVCAIHLALLCISQHLMPSIVACSPHLSPFSQRMSLQGQAHSVCCVHAFGLRNGLLSDVLLYRAFLPYRSD